MNDGLKITEIGSAKAIISAITESTGIYMYVTELNNGQHSFVYHSPQCERVTGYKPEEYISDPSLWQKMIHSEDINYVLKHINSHDLLQEGDVIEHRIVHKNGGVKWVSNHYSINIDKSPEQVRTHGIILDITEQKENEIRIRDALQKAEEATVLKDKFVSLIAHDLKSPLSAISCFLNLVKKSGKMNSQQTEIIERTLAISQNMCQLIDDLLDIARFHTSKMVPIFSFFCGFRTATKAIDNLSHFANLKGIRIHNHIQPNTRIYGDPTLIQQVINNLLTNAIKFCNTGDQISIYCDTEGETTLKVIDTGIGIQKEILETLFEYEAPTSTLGTAGERGTGLGLPYCKEVINAHNGTFRIESQLGEGTAISITLPPVTPIILIVDDNPDVRLIIQELVKPLNVSTIEAENGRDALNAIGSTMPHMIMCDIRMPIMDGFEFLETIKSCNDTKKIPFIMITSSHGEEVRNKALQMGANDFIDTPIKSQDFIPRIRRYIV